MSSTNVYSPATKRNSVADNLAKLDLWPKDERTIVKDGVLSVCKSKNDWRTYYCCIKGSTFSVFKTKGDEIAYRVIPLKESSLGALFPHEKLPLYCTLITTPKHEYIVGHEHQETMKEWLAQCEAAGAKIAASQAGVATPKTAGESSPLSTSPDSIILQKPKRRMSLQTPFLKRRNSREGRSSSGSSPQDSRSTSPQRSSPRQSIHSASAPLLAVPDDGPASDPEKFMAQTAHKFTKKGLMAPIKCDSCGEKISLKAWICQICYCAIHKQCANGPGVSRLCLALKGIDSTKKRSSLNATLQTVPIEHIPNDINASFLEKTWTPQSKKDENPMLASAFSNPIIATSASLPRIDTANSSDSLQSSGPDSSGSVNESDSIANIGQAKSKETLKPASSSPSIVSGSIALSFRKRFNSGSFVITTQSPPSKPADAPEIHVSGEQSDSGVENKS
jgi:hypothetical protein